MLFQSKSWSDYPCEPKPPRWLKERSSKALIGSTAFVAAFTEGFIYSTVVPVLPFSLVERLGVPEEDGSSSYQELDVEDSRLVVQYWLSLLLMVFGITMTLGAPIAGWVADHTSSRQTPLLFGLGLAYGATLLFCFATSPFMLILARCFQGFASSILFTAGLALIADSVSADEVGSWMGFVLSGMNLGALIGPFIAGALYEHAGYYSVFGVVLGVLVFDTILRLIMIEKKTAAKWLGKGNSTNSNLSEETPLCPEGPGTCCNSSDSDCTSVCSSTDDATSNPCFASPSNSSEASVTIKVYRNPVSWFQHTFPTMSCLLSSPRLAAAVYGCFTHTTLIAAFDAILPLFVKRTFGWTSTGAGLIFLAITIPSLLGVVFGALSDRYGPKIVSLIGFAITIPALACLGLVTGPVLSQQALLVVLLAIIGIGLNTLLAPLAADMFYEVDILAEQNPETFGKAGAYAQAYSLFDGALGFATFVGPAWGGLFYEKASWGVCMLTLAGFAAFGVIPVWKFTGGGKMGRGNDEDGEC